MRSTACGLVALSAAWLAPESASAALLGRDLNGSPGSFEAYYDTALDITWLADANYAQTSGYDADGLMTWSAAQAWIASLNAQNAGLGYLGYNDWRLPTITDTGVPGCVTQAFGGTDCGWNVDLATGEMANLFYGTLGNAGFFDTSGNPTGCSETLPRCLTSPGPFTGLQPAYYWSDTAYAPNDIFAWIFGFSVGLQDYGEKTNDYYAWAVRTGDTVPVPAAVWLFGSAVGALGLVRRLRSTGIRA